MFSSLVARMMASTMEAWPRDTASCNAVIDVVVVHLGYPCAQANTWQNAMPRHVVRDRGHDIWPKAEGFQPCGMPNARCYLITHL